MPLLGSAAMLLSFDVEDGAVEEHDRWHTHEHLPERLSIPGFLRGTRWVASEGQPRYMVLYEVQHLAVLASEAYLARLNSPSPWTRKMMPHYRGMQRGLCKVVGSFGFGQGGTACLLRFSAHEGRAAELQEWLLRDALGGVPTMTGLGSAHLLQGAAAAAMTNEQRIRGADASVDSALIVTGYESEAVHGIAVKLERGMADRGAREMTRATYMESYSLVASELTA
ncbi:hypothetical protein JJB11_09340 [Ramlibacter ginsenosidimutans]|uniref:Uncharacterized protein n=1 Tax=Ramlibacter ginsenosidimutans TaxID=502333 RepID=A0A934TT57_9BURK|nr:DUF4286 family protein [Ramlibacter ginsenosidimutans]MBK6006292.1 hypothetical protein [Ramlibacter ginsenosidimutans]